MNFLQESGEDLKFRFEKGTYGPYADNLRHVLHNLEGHFTLGFGDGRNNPRTPIGLLNDAVEQGQRVIAVNYDPKREKRARCVFQLRAGFETPCGLELLASVHWVARESNDTDLNAITSAIHKWNGRKRKVMKSDHIARAWQHLKGNGWLN